MVRLALRFAMLLLSLVLLWPLTVRTGGRWPVETITVASSSAAWPAALGRAIEGWNEAEVGVRFEPTRERSDADVIVGASSDLPRSCHNLDAIACTRRLGWSMWDDHNEVVMPTPKSEDGRTLRELRQVTETYVHELGHVLGLPHRPSGCSVMRVSLEGDAPECSGAIERLLVSRPVVRDPGCARGLASSRLIEWLCPGTLDDVAVCGPLPDDVEAASAIYGGQGRAIDPFCHHLVRIDPRRRIVRRYQLQTSHRWPSLH